jgi:hypothetical protein
LRDVASAAACVTARLQGLKPLDDARVYGGAEAPPVRCSADRVALAINLKLEAGGGLFFAHAAFGDVGDEHIFGSDWNAGDAAQDGDLADVG